MAFALWVKYNLKMHHFVKVCFNTPTYKYQNFKLGIK